MYTFNTLLCNYLQAPEAGLPEILVSIFTIIYV